MIQLVFAAMVSALASPAVPQAPAAGDQPIVITGQKDTQKTVQDFVKALTPVESHGQLSRFEHEVCPKVFGIPEAQARAVEDRVRLVAKTVGVVVGGQHCTPNVLLLVTSDKKAFLKELQRHASNDYGISDHQFHLLEDQPGHAAAWQVQGPMMNADGNEITEDSEGFPVNRTIIPSSRITVPVRPQFDASVVVVERRALVGLTTTQLADYVAVRALTGADPLKLANSGAPTILRVLDVPIGGEAPVTMTRWDFDLLSGFYDAKRDLSTAAQRSAIARGMTNDLQHGPHN
jgi:hypothetical protein